MSTNTIELGKTFNDGSKIIAIANYHQNERKICLLREGEKMGQWIFESQLPFEPSSKEEKDKFAGKTIVDKIADEPSSKEEKDKFAAKTIVDKIAEFKIPNIFQKIAEINNPEKKWREFEKYCMNLLIDLIDEDKYKVDEQYTQKYPTKGDDEISQVYRMDCRIAERRQGGKSIVIDFKHFPKSKLNRNEIETTLNYKRKCKASHAIIMYSYTSGYTNNFFELIEENKDISAYKIDFSKTGEVFESIKKHILKRSDLKKFIEDKFSQ